MSFHRATDPPTYDDSPIGNGAVCRQRSLLRIPRELRPAHPTGNILDSYSWARFLLSLGKILRSYSRCRSTAAHSAANVPPTSPRPTPPTSPYPTPPTSPYTTPPTSPRPAPPTSPYTTPPTSPRPAPPTSPPTPNFSRIASVLSRRTPKPSHRASRMIVRARSSRRRISFGDISTTPF